MKQTLLILLLVSASLVAKAQTSQGGMMVGGALAFSGTSYQGSDNKQSSSLFSPSFGYFIADDLVVGGSLSFGSSKSETAFGDVKQTEFAIGPFARYYKFTANDRFAFYGEAGLSFGSGKTDSGAGDTKSTNITFSVAPGFSYFFTDHWSLEFDLTLLRVSSNDPNTDNDNDKSTSVVFGLSTFNPSFGVRYYFGN